MNKVLIDDNRQAADRHIQAENAKADRMTSIIQIYNQQAALKPLDRSTALEFLRSPKAFLDNAIIRDSGMTLKNVKADKLAELVGIEYHQICNLISPWDVDNFILDENLKVQLSAEARERIVEQHKFYLTQDEDIQAYREYQKAAEVLTDYIEKMGIDKFDSQGIARLGGFDSKTEDGKFIYIPDIRNLKRYIENRRKMLSA